MRGYDAPDTLVSLCFVDDFTRVGHLRRDKPDNGRSSCPRKTVSQSHLAPSRINEKNAAQHPVVICPISREIFSAICRLELCVSYVSLNVYNLASSRISLILEFEISRDLNVSSVLSHIRDFANTYIESEEST